MHRLQWKSFGDTISRSMKNNASIFYALLLIVGDFLALLAAFAIAYILRVKIDERPLIQAIAARTYLFAFITVLPLWIMVHGFIGLYSHHVYERRFAELGRLLVGSFLGILVVIGYDFITPGALFPARLVPVYALITGFVLLVLFRWVARIIREALYLLGYGISNVLVVGDTPITEELVASMNNAPKTGQQIIATIGRKVYGITHYESFQSAITKLKSPVHSIIQTELYKNQDANNEIISFAQKNHVAFRFVPGNSDLFVGNIEVELFAGLPMVAIHQTALIGWGRILKRIFDVVFATFGLLVSSPVIILVYLLQKLFSPKEPAIYRQNRLTRFNNVFWAYKFRTLIPAYNGMSPEEAFAAMGKPDLAKKFRENGDFLPNDPRFSGLGRILRATSLDELPQLINVLQGDISLVGPRALVPEELNAYEKKHAILSVKSGLTGLAQVSGRKSISFEERRKLDVYYVQNWSFWLDIVIIIKTIWSVLTGSGAK
ncbi:MAG: sugar transferase [Patescibacteria group bacterium]